MNNYNLEYEAKRTLYSKGALIEVLGEERFEYMIEGEKPYQDELLEDGEGYVIDTERKQIYCDTE